MQPSDTIPFKCFHGGELKLEEDEVVYVGGSCAEGIIDICAFSVVEKNKMVEKLGYCHKDVDCFYHLQGGYIQILCDDETNEELKVEGVTHGAIILYLVHHMNEGGHEEDLHDVNINVEFSDELEKVRTMDVQIELVDLTGDIMVNANMDGEENEETCDVSSEGEEVVDDIEAGSSDDEFIDLQKKKKEWMFRRDTFEKSHVMKHDKEELEMKFSVLENIDSKRSGEELRVRGIKDDYWGEDVDETIEFVHQEGQCYERESDNEGPLNPSDDEEDPDVIKNCEWPLYDPNTPFGSVQLELGQLFQDVGTLRKALIYYSCQTHTSWKYFLNGPNRVLVKCRLYPNKCSWKLSARYTKEHGCLQIRFFKDVHTCTPTMRNKRVTSNFLAEEYQEKLLKHPTWKLKLFVKDVEATYGVKINRWQAARAKKSALSACAKVVGRQYESLRDYIYELKRSNVGTSVFLVLKPHISNTIPQFHMMYINFAALRQGSLHGCRKVLGLDGAFLKRYCKGELLSAIGRDANNQMFPVAWAIVESESKESWSWFLKHLIDDLDMKDGKGWTLLSDQQKGLLPAIAQMLPSVEHRLCARHIFTNWMKIIRGPPLHKLFWRAVKAYTEKEFQDVTEELRRQSERAYKEMHARNVKKFCRCFLNNWASTDVTCNNMAETFNSWILEAREKPILTMLEDIRRQVMSRMMEKKTSAEKCNGIVTPRVRMKLNDFRKAITNWRVIEANKDVYEVQHIHKSKLSFTVRLDQRTCACRYWDMNGIPCEHATAAICAKDEEPESYVAFWYNKSTYKAAYSFSLEPVNGQDLWKKVEGGPILPSDPKVKHGRPSNKRKRAYNEVGRKTHAYRLHKGGKQSCSNCKEPGHKSRTCPYRVVDIP